MNICTSAFNRCTRCFLLFSLLFILSCNNNGKSPDVKERNDMLDGDDTQQPMQDQDSVNDILNEQEGSAVDTLPNGLK